MRREGLTFSYLVLRREGAGVIDTLADAITAPAGAARLRVVSDILPSKGKREAFLCGEVASADGLVPARVRCMRLDRDATADNSAWDDLSRGDLLVVEPAPDMARPRITRASTVRAVDTISRTISTVPR